MSTVLIGYGACVLIQSSPGWTLLNALFLIARSIVHPVNGSVADKVQQQSPSSVKPQWATVSASNSPGVVGGSSRQVRVLIEQRSICESLVPDRLAAGYMACL